MNQSAEDLATTPHEDGAVLLTSSDYAGIAVMFSVTTMIGIYFGFFGKKNMTTGDFMDGGKKMKVIPVALSLVASHTSGVILISVPAEVFTHNALYIMYCPILIIALICTWYYFLPVFFNLNLQNSYEYVEMRFSKTTKNVASAIYLLSSFLYLPFTIYVPALSLSQVTGLNLYYISIGVSCICIFYTAVGGLKAFVWSDCFQTSVLVMVSIVILIVGTYGADGFHEVLTTARQGRILDIFDFNMNPFVRNTFWTMIVGSFFDIMCVLVAQQDSIQRFTSVPNIKDVKIVLVIYWIAITGMMIMSVYAGILVYSVYFGCDPIERGLVGEADQIFPFFVIDKIRHIFSFPGLFIAGVLSGGLSYLAAILNTVAGSIYNDYIKRDGISQRKEKLIIRSLIVIGGIYTVAMVPVVENMGTLLSVMYTLDSITAAPCLSFFALGMLVPFCNSTGAIAGAISSMLVLTWIAVGSTIYGVNNATHEVYPGIPNTCNHTMSDSNLDFSERDAEALRGDDVFFLYKLSFITYTAFGTIINMIVAIIVSWLTGPTDLTKLDPNLISPPLRKYLPKSILDETLESLNPTTELENIKNKDPMWRGKLQLANDEN